MTNVLPWKVVELSACVVSLLRGERALLVCTGKMSWWWRLVKILVAGD